MGKITTYLCGQSVRLTSGTLSLTDDQYKRRKTILDGAKGKCTILQAVEFKAGEVIGYDGGEAKMYNNILINKKDYDEAEQERIEQENLEADKRAEAEKKKEVDLLDKTIPEIVAALEGLTAEEIDKLEADEINGKTRDGVINAIEAERKKRG